ncbi:YfcL family protein [Thalassotalea nanhaiensis]|uniref:YfcL family protein n=1 Tax=Thalassotalea nanhaiensis TaxID=3065648 RepID=A0ABY9TFB0_9GAMM|nr:YfcL family protein [Colwelliaceae bacterium SQ345]
MINTENVENLEQLFCYFDGLIELDCDDQLFASSYLRGFLEVAAVEFGHQQQPLSTNLYSYVDKQILAAQDELSAPDQAIVVEFWRAIKPMFSRAQ